MLSQEEIKSFLEGTDPEQFIVAVEFDYASDSIFKIKQDFPADVADILYNLPENQFYGPYLMGEYYAVSKAIDRKSNAKARASHILISYTGSKASPREPRTKDEALAKANELLVQVNANSNMLNILAYQFSDDQGSAQQGGDLNFLSLGLLKSI